MKLLFTRLCGLIISGCWLLCGQQSNAQGSFISHTRLENPNPGGIFGNEGYPVYTPGSDFPSTLGIDLNHDGITDFNVVATGTSTWGFQLDGIGQNAAWSRPAGGTDINSFVIPLTAGTSIGGVLPTPDQWVSGSDTPFGRNAPVFSAYSSIGGLGYFIDKTAYAGLQFYVGDEVYYGWIKVQEIPFLQGGGIVFEYAYDTRPYMPIMAGAVPEPSTWALLIAGLVLFGFSRRKRHEY